MTKVPVVTKNSGVAVVQERITTWHAKTSADQL